MRNRFDLLHVTAIAALLLTVCLCEARAEVTVSDAWIRALPSSLPSGGYFTLRNDGPKPVTLTGAGSPACGMLMLHKSQDHGGMGAMEDVIAIAVPAGGTLKFAPGGYHLMCMDATPAIRTGGSVPVTLAFKNAAPVTVKFQVRNAAGK